MLDFLSRLLDTSDFPARWHCGHWTAAHGWLHVVSDLGVWSAYLAISFVLGYFVLRRKDIPFRSIFILFGAFILACGTTHLMEAIIFWWPDYRLAGVIKLFTACVSWGTVLALIPVTPRVLSMPSHRELEREIQSRQDAERRLEQVNADLQRQVMALRASEERFRLLVDGTKDYAILMLDPTGRIASWNPGAERLFGYQSEEIVGKSVAVLIPPGLQGEEAAVLERLKRGVTINHYESIRLRKDGSSVPVSLTISPIRDQIGNIIGISKIARDITERKRAEEQIRASLLEKETLLHEIHHRVKNNLAVIGSSFYLQSTYVPDERTVQVLQNCQDRVRSMALVHERLYHSGNFASVDFAEYAEELATGLIANYSLRPDTVRLRLDLEKVTLNLRRAVPCALILNELVANALKHAFPAGQTGEIRIGLKGLDGDGFELWVADDGIGLPDMAQLESPRSFGMRLLRSLTKQLDGRMEFIRLERGLEARLSLEPSHAEER
jgi:PAS domain S-box-containing protein